MPKPRSKEEDAAYQRARRARHTRPSHPPENVTPGVTPGPNVPPMAVMVSHPANSAPPLAHVDPASPLMAPYRFVPNWVAHGLAPPSPSIEQRWQAHVAPTLFMTGHTPAENWTLAARV